MAFLVCPSCQETFTVSDQTPGGAIRCPQCKTLIRLPTTDHNRVGAIVEGVPSGGFQEPRHSRSKLTAVSTLTAVAAFGLVLAYSLMVLTDASSTYSRAENEYNKLFERTEAIFPRPPTPADAIAARFSAYRLWWAAYACLVLPATLAGAGMAIMAMNRGRTGLRSCFALAANVCLLLGMGVLYTLLI
jgi:hypothetical protein